MRLDLDPALFSGTTSENKVALDLLQLFNEALGHRNTGVAHHLIADPDSSPLCDWLARRGTNERDMCRLALSAGYEGEARSPCEARVAVIPGPAADWKSTPVRIPLTMALRLIKRPLCLLVEDNMSDAAFLRAVVPDTFKRTFTDLCDGGLVAFENGGGLSNIMKRVKEERHDPLWRLRTFVVYDSDALAPGFPSQDSQELGRLCGASVKNYRLDRRASENYIPVEALEIWVESTLQGDEGRQKREVVRALRTAPNNLRYHFNMKRGCDGDLKRIAQIKSPEECDAIFTLLSEAGDDVPDRSESLRKGLGRDVWNAFEVPIPNHWLDDDNQLSEMISLFQRILART
jgi:hypothetical protein